MARAQTSQPSTTTDDVTIVSRVQRDLGAWRSFLRDENARLDEFHLAAAMVTIGLHRAGDFGSATDLVEAILRPTDHIAMLSSDEMSVLLAPVQDIREAKRLVHVIDAKFHAAGIDAHIGWAMRHDGHGLFHAAARADAAMLTAKGHGNLAFDLSKR